MEQRMAISIQINAAFTVGDSTYTANMALPDSAPTGQAPFVFLVTTAPTKSPTTTTTLLTVAVGAANEVYVAVAPPADLIQAAAGNIVQALDVVVSEGTYDPKTKTFTSP
jgi:hypothetical protein